MTREHHAWSAMARSNRHCRHLFAVVCPMPQSDTPWAVVCHHGAALSRREVTLAAPETPRPPQPPSL